MSKFIQLVWGKGMNLAMMMMMYVCEEDVCLLCAGSECERRRRERGERRGLRDFKWRREERYRKFQFVVVSSVFLASFQLSRVFGFLLFAPWKENLW